MARARTIAGLAALLVAAIAGVADVADAADVREPGILRAAVATAAARVREPVAHRLALRLAVTPAVWDTGTKPRLELHFDNHGKSPARVVSPLDGSWDGMREPAYALELLDETGAPIADALGPTGARCGLTNELQAAEDIHVVAPGKSVDAHASANSFPFYAEIGEAARPGEYLAQVRYKANLAGANHVELVSNRVKVSIRGGSPKLWHCYHTHQQQAARYTYSESTPHDLQALGADQAALYVRTEISHTAGKPQQRQGELLLQRVGPAGPRLPPTSLTSHPGLGHARALPIDGGLLVAYTVDARIDGVGKQSLYTLIVSATDDTLHIGPPRLHAADLATAYNISLARAGDRLGIIYLRADSPNAASVMFLRFDTAGAPIEKPQRLDSADYLSDAQLAATPHEFLATFNKRGSAITILRLGLDGRAQAPAVVVTERLGSIDAIWPLASGFALEYHKSYTLGSVPDDRMGYFFQGFDAAGNRRGAPTALSPVSVSDPFWGTLARGDGGAARAYAVEHIDRTGRTTPVSDLMFGPVGTQARKVSSTLLGEPQVHAVADDFFVAWSDARDDTSRACQRLGSCVGDVYVASWKRGQQPLLAPTRISSSATPRPPVSEDGRWLELCD